MVTYARALLGHVGNNKGGTWPKIILQIRIRCLIHLSSWFLVYNYCLFLLLFCPLITKRKENCESILVLKRIEKNLSCQEFECLTQVLISQNYFRFSPKILLTRTSMAKNLKLIRLKQIDGIGSIIDKSKYLSHCAIQAWTVFRYLYD